MKWANRAYPLYHARAASRLPGRTPQPQTAARLLRRHDWRGLALVAWAAFCWLCALARPVTMGKGRR